MTCPDCDQELHPVHPHTDAHICQIFLHTDNEPCPVSGATKYMFGEPLLFTTEQSEDLPLNYLDGNTDVG